MADDTVHAARRDLLVEIDDRLERAVTEQSRGSGRIVERIDALIAAVRAEQTICSCGTTMICPDIGCDKHKLTDAEVDAFLAAVDETDPERVERIRKLFNQKLEER